MQYIFLSHDVDWRRQGPPVKHILERKDRFDSEIFTNTKPENLYRNIPEYMELEEKFGIRSTFFFRTLYENGNKGYKKIISIYPQLKGKVEIDRKKLTNLIRQKIIDLKKIEKIIHPLLKRSRLNFIKENQKKKIIYNANTISCIIN